MEEPPLLVVGWGVLAGLAGTLVLSGLSRFMPGKGSKKRQVPEVEGRDNPVNVTPAGALAKEWGPGPEGAAELFALKFASGLLSRDISSFLKLTGKTVHFLYGSFWGIVYGLVQASYHLNPFLLGAIAGLIVWAVGPGFLVPAMKLMRSPRDQPLLNQSMMILGHIVYGITVAIVFDCLERR